MSTTTVSLRIDNALQKQLSEVAECTERSKSWHLEQALRKYLESQQWQIDNVKRGLADLQTDSLHPHAKAVKKLNSWGKSSKRRRK